MLEILKNVPALVAIIAGIIFLLKIYREKDIPLIFFILCLIFICGVELLMHTLMEFYPPESLGFSLRLYYATAVVSCFSYLVLIIELFGRLSKTVAKAMALAAIMFALLVSATDYIVEGVSSIGYSLTRVEGPYYWTFQVFVVTCLLFGWLALINVYIKSGDWIIKRKALVMLLAFSALILAVSFVVMLMMIDFRVNATILIPILTILLIAILAYGRYENRLFKMLSLVPNSSEYQLTLKTIQAMKFGGMCSFQDAVTDFERGVIADMLQKCQGNKTLAAKKLGISRATLRRKMGDTGGLAD